MSIDTSGPRHKYIYLLINSYKYMYWYTIHQRYETSGPVKF